MPEAATLRGLDAADGSPVLDIKPVMSEVLARDLSEPDWSRRLMSDYYTLPGSTDPSGT